MNFENKPKLILFCGLPGSGKTTLGRKLASETAAVRLCPDEWMTDLGVDLFDEALRAKLEDRLWKLGQEILALGQDVILENGLWTKQERDDKRRDAELLNAHTEIHFFDIKPDELWRRLQKRNVSGDYGVVPINYEQITEYAKIFQPPTQTELELFDDFVIHTAISQLEAM